MNAKPPFVFLFDIDGTLLASGGAGKVALEDSLLTEFQLDAIRVQVPYGGRTDLSIVSELLTVHDIQPTPERITRLQQAYLRRLPDALQRLQGRVLPGVLDMLQGLQQHHEPVLIGLLTGNIRQGAAVKLGHFGIAHHFIFGGYGDDHHDRNDVARSAWSAAESHHGRPLDPQRTWVIGDTPLDVSCARHIGANVAAVATGYHKVEQLAECQPDLVLSSLSEVNTLARMLGI
jgi:phosphoglycolate phosphatase